MIRARRLTIMLGRQRGTYLLLPHRHGRARSRGSRVHAAGYGPLGRARRTGRWSRRSGSRSGEFLSSAFFYLPSALAAVAGRGHDTITSRNPIYSALWFAARSCWRRPGLFLLAEAQFLAAGHRSSSTPVRSSSPSCSSSCSRRCRGPRQLRPHGALARPAPRSPASSCSGR